MSAGDGKPPVPLIWVPGWRDPGHKSLI